MNANTQRTYDQIFQHPLTENLEWRAIRAMFESLGDVEAEDNGNLKITVAGQSEVFQSVTDTDIAPAEQVMRLRHFLENTVGEKPSHSGQHFLVVIDHKEAQIFRTEMKGAVPEQVVPYDPDGTKAHVHSHTHEDSGHNEQPKHDAYFEAIAKKLQDAEQILIFGSGTGASSAMDQFVAWLEKHHRSLSKIVIGAVKVDQTHLREAELLAKARQIYSDLGPSN